MNYRFWHTGAWRTMTRCRARKGGAWREIKTVRVWVDALNAWKTVWVKGGTTPTPPPPPGPPPGPPGPSVTLNVTATPSGVRGATSVAGPVTTAPVTVTCSNGTAPYTYVFSRVSYPTAPPVINVGPANVATATLSVANPGDFYTAELKCAVRDSVGNTGSVQFTATFVYREPIDTRDTR